MPEVYGPFASVKECTEFGNLKALEIRARDGDVR
jgi:hypothetical protein